jgi:hypothetical protein
MHRQTTRYRTLADVALWTGSARIFAGDRIDQLGLEASPYSPGEQTRHPNPMPTEQFGAGSASNSFLRISGFGRCFDARSARMTSEFRKNKQSPNQAMEPTRPNVTDRAFARSAPFGRAAHLHR